MLVMTRALRSWEPPAPSGTIKVIGFSGILIGGERDRQRQGER